MQAAVTPPAKAAPISEAGPTTLSPNPQSGFRAVVPK